MEAKLLKNHEDACAGSSLVCSDCGKGLLMEANGKKWNKCEFCGDPVCINCNHYVGTMTRDLWKDFINIRRVCRRCVIKF